MPLTPSQTEAVNTCEGFQLILAGPGSGKIRVITEKILHLIDRGIPPNQILALTFSDKAASEMGGRRENVKPHPGLAVHTFPTFCLDILGRERARERDVGVGGDHQPHNAAGPGPAEYRCVRVRAHPGGEQLVMMRNMPGGSDKNSFTGK
jgi:superfamily I DNA/RNA helicase